MVSDIPAGDGKLVNLFLRCRWVSASEYTAVHMGPNKFPESSTHADFNCLKNSAMNISSFCPFYRLNVVPKSIATALSHLLGKRRAARQPTMATEVTPATAVTSAAAMTPATAETSAAAMIASNSEDSSNSRVFHT